MDERVDAVDGRGYPGDEQGDEEEGGDFCVAERRSIGFHGRTMLSQLPVFAAGVVRECGSGGRGDFDVVFGVADARAIAGIAACGLRRSDQAVGLVFESVTFEVAGHLVVCGFEGEILGFGRIVEFS